MNKGTANIIAVLAALLALGACGTTQQQPYTGDRPIFSASDAKSMISVEVRVLEPIPVENAVAAVYPETDRLLADTEK